MESTGSARGRRRGACGASAIGAASRARAVSSAASIQARGRRLGPPPAQRSTTALLAATRSQGVERGRCLRGPAVRAGALENEERGMSRRAKGRQPGRGRGAGWASSAIRSLAWQCHREGYRDRSAVERVSCRACLSCDSCLLESRSPPRDASAGRSWRWPGCCPRQRSRPSPGRLGWS